MVNQHRGFPMVSDLIFLWTKQKPNTPQEFKSPCYHLASDYLELTYALRESTLEGLKLLRL